MYELSLFTGAGGGLLGTHLLGWTPIGYVEFNDYCQRVIRQRIVDGILPNAPIYGDIRTFISSGCAELYRGVAEVITAGFPCQPFSSAGEQLGEDDPRNMWPATIECIRIIRPKFALLENVANLLSYRYFGTILADLAESGFDVRWRVLSAAECGASHRRDRVWIMAHATSIRRNGKTPDMGREMPKQAIWSQQSGGRNNKTFIGTENKSGWPIHEPWVRREPDGVAHRVDRLRAAGNGQVPAVVRTAWELLTDQPK